ncbi:50S ribosomal protein L11 methyltransferase [Cohaesibacter sp. CAU 1516]|uniref:class I SAM-dependent methyltransferase n=1 Tax=Cohaesibacter sp. CAU 1516 TaxID=2576038 RepID=UPI001FEFDFF1|nr:50S ribosomal protein L11 methyltransferase [Cohaesibacter sp. CAU 1516]
MPDTKQTGIADKAAFIRGHTAILPVPLTPDIVLHLADDDTPLWRMSEEELNALGLPSPFWAFAWAGGQALARFCLDHSDLLSNKTVLDFASGSGLIAIAAIQAGAKSALATDIDPFAIEAIRLNAALNGLNSDQITPSIEDCLSSDGTAKLLASPPDIMLAGDVFYDAEMSRLVVDLMKKLHACGTVIYVGDPTRSYLPKNCLVERKAYSIPRSRALEDAEIRSTKVWQFRP